jgi:hypothetical protein
MAGGSGKTQNGKPGRSSLPFMSSVPPKPPGPSNSLAPRTSRGSGRAVMSHPTITISSGGESRLAVSSPTASWTASAVVWLPVAAVPGLRGPALAAPPPGPAGFAGVLPHLALYQPWRGHFVARMAVCSCTVGAGLLRALAWALGADCLTAKRLRPAAGHASANPAPSNGAGVAVPACATSPGTTARSSSGSCGPSTPRSTRPAPRPPSTSSGPATRRRPPA